MTCKTAADEATSPTSAEQPPSQGAQKAQKLVPMLPNGERIPLKPNSILYN